MMSKKGVTFLELILVLVIIAIGASLAMTPNKNRAGFALVMAIFLVIGLETVIAGAMLNMMRLQREAQRSADEMRISWIADAVMERTVKLLLDYIEKTEGEFPDRIITEVNGEKIVIGGADNASANAVTGGVHQDFDDYIVSWYENALRNKSEYSPALSQISISDVKIIQLEQDPSGADLWRRYRVDVTGKKLSGTAPTAFKATISQEMKLLGGQLFNFFVFCNEDCEFTAGPSTDLQGPIFSNKDIYLMNDAGSTLRLLQADNFDLPGNPEPYVIHAAGHIYFYFPRLVGRNYMLDDPKYFNAVPHAYKFAGTQTPEVFPGYDLAPGDPLNKKYPPFFHFVNNFADLGCATGVASNGTPCATNTIKVQTGPNLSTDFAQLIPARSPMVLKTLSGYVDYWNRASNSIDNYYTSDYGTSGQTSLSSAFNVNNLADVDLIDIVVDGDPQTVDFLNSDSDPPANPNRLANPAYGSGMVQDEVPQKKLPIRSTGVSENETHALIERCTSNPSNKNNPCGTDESFKLHAKAARKLTRTGTANNTRSTSFIQFSNWGILTQAPGASQDYRSPGYIVFTLDMARLLARFGENAESMLIYFSIKEDINTRGYNTLRVINGSKLPRNGVTIATDGSLWIQGDYNTFDYNTGKYCTEPDPSQPDKNFWDNGNCHVPPAAIFSDNFGALSNEWKTRLEGYGSGRPLSGRLVLNDVMVNTAVAAGYRPSQLSTWRLQSPWGRGMCSGSDCPFAFLGGGPLWTIPNTSPFSSPPKTGLLTDFFGTSMVAGRTFRCDDESYKNYPTQGLSGVTPSCEFYEERPGIYFLNPKTTTYQIARARLGSTLPCTLVGDINGDNYVDAADWVAWQKNKGRKGPNLAADLDGNNVVDDADEAVRRAHFGNSIPSNCLDNVRIPIFADANTINNPEPTAVPGYPGVYFSILYKGYLYGAISQPRDCEVYYTCSAGSPDPGPPYTPIPKDDNHCQWQDCEPGEESTCAGAGWINCSVRCPSNNWSLATRRTRNCHDSGPPVVIPPKLSWNTNYWPIYELEYSGGIENLINLQEDWRGRTFRFLGTLSAPWFSERLKAYNPDIYSAPSRKFDYNEDLRAEPPPGTPGVFSLERGRWSRRFD